MPVIEPVLLMLPILAGSLALVPAQSTTAKSSVVGSQPAASQAAGARAFEAYAWRSAPEPEGARAVWAALGGVLVQRGEERASLRAAGLAVALFNGAGRDDLHLDRERPGFAEHWQRWYDTRDPALLVREPCLTDPATLERLASILEASLAAPGLESLDWLSLGDEVGLTPHGAPSDVCWSATCRAAWQRFLAGRSELTDAERSAWAEPAASSTDRARAALAEGDFGALHPWLLRRQFQAAVVEGVLAGLVRQARARAPKLPLALLGMGAQSAFGTPRIERGLAGFEVLEAYRESDARELLLTLRGADSRVLLTVFPTAAAPELAAWSIWEHALRGGDGVVVWSDSDLAAAPELSARVTATLSAVRSLRAQPGAAFAPRGVALVHDFESLCLDWLRDALLDGPTWPRRLSSHQLAHGTWESSAAGWLRLASDCGQAPGAVPLENVEAATAARFGVLVLSELSVLDEADFARLEDYVAAGGRLLVSGDLGRCDSRGRKPARPAIERLRAAGGQRVLSIEGSPAVYLEERHLRSASARAWRAAAAGWFADAGLESPPWSLEPSSPDHPWIQCWTRAPDGSVLGAVLPAWHDIEGNAELPELMLEIAPREGFALEWLHPAEGETADGPRLLPAGDAAVFRLYRR
jgi:hypothetical protein